LPERRWLGLSGRGGKGKTTDFLAEQVAWSFATRVATTLTTQWSPGTRSSSSTRAAGVLYPHITSVIGNGVVVNPATLIAGSTC
jgi:adenylosuccinate synthase